MVKTSQVDRGTKRVALNARFIRLRLDYANALIARIKYAWPRVGAQRTSLRHFRILKVTHMVVCIDSDSDPT